MTLWWCPSCGIVWASDTAPICRHMVIDPPNVTRMIELPPGHPFAENHYADGTPR